MDVVQNSNKVKRIDSTYTGDDVLSIIQEELMERILIYMEFKDLLSLTRTSKKLRDHVQIFCYHYVLSHSKMEKLNEFLNCGLLNPSESVIKKMITQCGKLSLQTSLYFFKCSKMCSHLIHRYSIIDAEFLPDGNQYIVRKSQTLGRNIVVGWMHFKNILPQIPPGTYQVSVNFRQYCAQPLNWFDAHLKVVDVNGDKTDPPLVDVVMKAEYWKKIQNNMFDNVLVIKNGENWNLIKFKPFTILSQTDLDFEWRYVNPSWNWGNVMCFDYVQIEEM